LGRGKGFYMVQITKSDVSSVYDVSLMNKSREERGDAVGVYEKSGLTRDAIFIDL
jgi:hypothetical protein